MKLEFWLTALKEKYAYLWMAMDQNASLTFFGVKIANNNNSYHLFNVYSIPGCILCSIRN